MKNKIALTTIVLLMAIMFFKPSSSSVYANNYRYVNYKIEKEYEVLNQKISSKEAINNIISNKLSNALKKDLTKNQIGILYNLQSNISNNTYIKKLKQSKNKERLSIKILNQNDKSFEQKTPLTIYDVNGVNQMNNIVAGTWNEGPKGYISKKQSVFLDENKKIGWHQCYDFKYKNGILKEVILKVRIIKFTKEYI